MDALAAEAGVTKPILYRHFGDRAGLIRELADRFGGELRAELAAALTADGGPQETLVRAIDGYVRFVERNPQIYRFLTQQALAEHPEETVGLIRDVGREVALVIGERLREAGADSGAAEPWGYGMVGMVHLATDRWLAEPTMPRERLVAYLADLLWAGMRGMGIPDAETQTAGAIPIEGRRKAR